MVRKISEVGAAVARKPPLYTSDRGLTGESRRSDTGGLRWDDVKDRTDGDVDELVFSGCGEHQRGLLKV